MFHKIINFAAVLALACTGVHVAAQGTAEDYRRAFALGEKIQRVKSLLFRSKAYMDRRNR